jgi:anaerobic magnesium-protoporphyrin IX monomethyl ester cyclase
MSAGSKTSTSNRGVSVLLVHPTLPHNKPIKRIYPMGLLYMASYLKKHNPNVRVEIYNPQVTNTGFRETLRTVLSKEWDVLGMGYWTNQFQFSAKLSKAVKAARPEAFIIHGGVHATLRPLEAAQNSDLVILNEGEEKLSEVVGLFSEGSREIALEGTACMRDGEFQMTPSKGFIKDLDNLPFPEWEFLDLDKYTTQLHVVGGKRVPIIGSRGCPYNCSFCVSPSIWRRRVRWRSPENIVDEMEYTKSKFGIDQFHFWDDNILLNRKHVLKLAEEILRRNLKVRWMGLSRASHVAKAEDLFPTLARSGFMGLEIGIESANPAAYHIVGKNETLENLIKACEIQKKNGMFPMYTYMSFLPGDTIRGAYEQAKFMDDLLSGLPRYKFFHHLPFDVYIGQTCTPHVGTRMHDEVAQLGRPMWEDEEDFHHNATCFLPHSLLDDVPVRTIASLTYRDRAFCTILSYVSVADFLFYDSPFQKILNVAAFNFLLDKFWERCDGTKSILEIAKSIEQECDTGLSLNNILKFLASSAITLAQVGALDSKNNTGLAPMRRKRVKYKYAPVYGLMLQLSRAYGKLTGHTRFSMEPHRSYDT